MAARHGSALRRSFSISADNTTDVDTVNCRQFVNHMNTAPALQALPDLEAPPVPPIQFLECLCLQ